MDTRSVTLFVAENMSFVVFKAQEGYRRGGSSAEDRGPKIQTPRGLLQLSNNQLSENNLIPAQ